jgi:predicted dehydrogenase
VNISDTLRSRLETQLGFSLPPYRLDYENFRTDYRLGIVGLHWVMQIMQLPAYRAARYPISCAAEKRPEAVQTALAKGLVPDDIQQDWRCLVTRDDVDIVDSCFGHRPDREGKKLQLVRACVEAGKAVLVAKPVASTLSVAMEMLDLAQRSSTPVCINQNCRYNPAAMSVKHLLTPERMGRPQILEIRQYWRGDPKGDDDRRPGWMQHVVHHADLLRWWVGSPCVSVYAKCRQVSTIATYEFENGAVATHIENHTGVERNDNFFRVQTARGVIQGKHNWDWHLGNAEGRDVVDVYTDTSEPPACLPLPMLPYEPLWSDINKWLPHHGPWWDLAAPLAGMMGCVGSIMKALDEGTEPDNHLRDGVAALRMALAAEISAASGKSVDPRQIPPDYATVTEPPA